MAKDYFEVTGIIPAGFICPVCLRDLPLSCITPAHAPADALDGSVATYACKSCNNRMNREYEQKAIEAIRARNEYTLSVPGCIPVSAQVRIGEHPGGGVDVHFSHRRPRSQGAQNYRSAIAALPSAGSFSLTPKSRDDSTLRLARLSWTYLLAVKALGYRFACSACTRGVRDLILARVDESAFPFLIVDRQNLIPEELLIAWPADFSGETAYGYYGWATTQGWVAFWPSPLAESIDSFRGLDRETQLTGRVITEAEDFLELAERGNGGIWISSEAGEEQAAE